MVIVTKRNSALENKLWNWLKRISTRHLIILAENLKEVVPAPAKFAMGYSHFLQHVKQTIMLFDSIGAHVSSIVFPIRPGLFFLLWFLPCRSSVKKFEWRIDFLQKLITEQNLAAAFCFALLFNVIQTDNPSRSEFCLTRIPVHGKVKKPRFQILSLDRMLKTSFFQ